MSEILPSFSSAGGAATTADVQSAAVFVERVARAEPVVEKGRSQPARWLVRRLRRAIPRVAWTDDHTSAPASDLYLEAAGFDRAAQIMALRCMSAIAPDEAIIATTSPILSIAEIADNVTHPRRLIGFVPPLPGGSQVVELIIGEATAAEVRSAMERLARAMRLEPIPQRNGGPSLLMRLFGAVAIEAWNLATECGDPARVDEAARKAGLPVGPLRWLDRIGLPEVAQLLGREDQLDGMDRIYRDRSGRAVDPTFAAASRSTSVDPAYLAEFTTTALRGAATAALEDGLIDDRGTLEKALRLGLGLDAARVAHVMP